jgi:TetR/AcrR family transcriptional regulator, transcriptional repressor for nem operon
VIQFWTVKSVTTTDRCNHMARPKEFDTEQALDTGMHLLWRSGYETTSLDDLVSAMRLSKSSFYGTFGSKREFLLAALTRYTDVILHQLATDLERGSARVAITRSLKTAVRESGDSPRGCFVQNCAIELAHRDGEVQAKVRQAFDRLEEGYRRAIVRGQRTSEFGRHRDARMLARYLVMSLNGIQFFSRAGTKSGYLEEIVPVILSALE